MDNKPNYDKFYMYSKRQIDIRWEVNTVDIGIENLPSIFTDLGDLVENLPETFVPELYIYEVKSVEIGKMTTTKHGVCIKSKRFTIDSIINLFTQDPEIIRKLPHWLVLERLRSESGVNSTLNKNGYVFTENNRKG